MKLKTIIAMTAALMIGAGETTTVQAKEDRASCREVHAKKDGDKRAHARHDQGFRGSQVRGGFRGTILLSLNSRRFSRTYHQSSRHCYYRL
jgi:hypothetical protein